MTTQPTKPEPRTPRLPRFISAMPSTPGGHRFFIDGERAAADHKYRVAVADDSGRDPDKTDDGILYLKVDGTISPSRTLAGLFNLPLVRPNGEDALTVCDGREAFSVASAFGMTIDIGRGQAFTVSTAAAPADPDAGKLTKNDVRSIEATVQLLEMMGAALSTDPIARRFGGELAGDLMRSFLSYLSCLADERVFLEETVGGLCNSLKHDVERAIERSRR